MAYGLISNVFNSDFWQSSKCFNLPNIPNVILIIEKLPEVYIIISSAGSGAPVRWDDIVSAPAYG